MPKTEPVEQVIFQSGQSSDDQGFGCQHGIGKSADGTFERFREGDQNVLKSETILVFERILGQALEVVSTEDSRTGDCRVQIAADKDGVGVTIGVEDAVLPIDFD